MTDPFPTYEEFDDRAHHLYDAGEYDQALEVLRQGLAAHPDAAVLHVALGYVRIAREEWVWARRSFATALDLDSEHEDAWVGLGEALLKFGELDAARSCFAHVADLGVGDELEIGLAVGRALYREGLFNEARQRFTALALAHPGSAEVMAARGYTLHALGDDVGARRDLRRALRADPELHEARIYLAHLLYDGGDLREALAELQLVPPDEHWDAISVWRFMELKRSVEGCVPDAPELAAWQSRLGELEGEPDPIDHLLAEVEAAWEAADDIPTPPAAGTGEGGQRTEVRTHRVRTVDGVVFVGTWEEIVLHMRNTSPRPDEPLGSFMRRVAREARSSLGFDLPCDTAEAFVRGSARLGLLRIES